MSRKFVGIALLVLAALLTIGAAAAFAQGGRGQGGPGGPGGPQGGQGQPMQQGQTDPGPCCDGDPQMHAYQHGGIGFVDGRSGWRWDDENRQSLRGSRGAGQNGVGFYAALPPASDVPLSDAVIASMTAGLMDEYTAYGMYDAFVAQFGESAPFFNIRRAEAQHIAAWEFLFDRYGLELPAAPTVTAPAVATLTEACQVAAEIEIANMALYDEMLTTLADYPDMVRVVTALRDASQYHHLPAFEQCAGQ